MIHIVLVSCKWSGYLVKDMKIITGSIQTQTDVIRNVFTVRCINSVHWFDLSAIINVTDSWLVNIGTNTQQTDELQL